MSLKGGCLCGAVTDEVTAPFQLLGNCHCSMCRKSSGAAHVTWGILDCGTFRWTSGHSMKGDRPNLRSETTRDAHELQRPRYMPPSMRRLAPVVKSERGLARNATAAAISAGRPSRAIGCGENSRV
jgi:hypothetical protein